MTHRVRHPLGLVPVTRTAGSQPGFFLVLFIICHRRFPLLGLSQVLELLLLFRSDGLRLLLLLVLISTRPRFFAVPVPSPLKPALLPARIKFGILVLGLLFLVAFVVRADPSLLRFRDGGAVLLWVRGRRSDRVRGFACAAFGGKVSRLSSAGCIGTVEDGETYRRRSRRSRRRRVQTSLRGRKRGEVRTSSCFRGGHCHLARCSTHG